MPFYCILFLIKLNSLGMTSILGCALYFNTYVGHMLFMYGTQGNALINNMNSMQRYIIPYKYNVSC